MRRRRSPVERSHLKVSFYKTAHLDRTRIWIGVLGKGEERIDKVLRFVVDRIIKGDDDELWCVGNKKIAGNFFAGMTEVLLLVLLFMTKQPAETMRQLTCGGVAVSGEHST